MHKAQPGEKTAAEQKSMTAAASGGDSVADMGTGRRAEDIAAAQQAYTADKESAHSSQSRSHHGSNTGLEQQDPHTAAAEAGGLLSKEDIQRLDQEIGMRSDNNAGGSAGAREPVSSSGAPQLVGSRGTGFGSSIGTSSGDGKALETSGPPFTSGILSGSDHSAAIPGSDPPTGQEGNLQGHHTTRMGEMLDPHLKR
ncbi:hypothetical protein KC343_g9465 [Hortaea werneckii]|uniref:Uncharacterized protein n=1 Tax=Hortaea werneckii TaxID=91943 RepID=A0A3M7GW78_HORWE|nr:hypothetical protein KC323_g4816 [Hortaea werneckii]KAI7207240.1 hypothetical protein KC352_g17822 [Hortaea werneckii]KAI7353617.1 hypothetical protein KC320_g3925 [Hortaea werneckii]KAI7560585.1 hypothetical protein KC317_g9634 [Hortaea werneckii]KAI7596522.1 hypothetical protein KC346_g15106 [Hortaea werneckii]